MGNLYNFGQSEETVVVEESKKYVLGDTVELSYDKPAATIKITIKQKIARNARKMHRRIFFFFWGGGNRFVFKIEIHLKMCFSGFSPLYFSIDGILFQHLFSVFVIMRG